MLDLLGGQKPSPDTFGILEAMMFLTGFLVYISAYSTNIVLYTQLLTIVLLLYVWLRSALLMVSIFPFLVLL